jgi:hypothetical protein
MSKRIGETAATDKPLTAREVEQTTGLNRDGQSAKRPKRQQDKTQCHSQMVYRKEFLVPFVCFVIIGYLLYFLTRKYHKHLTQQPVFETMFSISFGESHPWLSFRLPDLSSEITGR